jgi:hypothetical protein
MLKKTAMVAIVIAAVVAWQQSTTPEPECYKAFHKVYKDKEIGFTIGQTGSFRYIINEETCEQLVQGGYHEFAKEEDGTLWGFRGAEKIKIGDKNGLFPPQYSVRGPTPGQEYLKALKEYEKGLK